MLKLLHNQLGILIAPFIFIASLTGLLYGLTPQLESFIYKEQLSALHSPNHKTQPHFYCLFNRATLWLNAPA
ncbi:PepSY domain-containing protein [Acinetobacter radioresistens]|uniref:PepSY domain-containing protein n=1 Tax=Acinetobacter radioresistens TaxID=40216 RepID=UPI00224B01AA